MARREVSELSIAHEHDLSTSLHLSRTVRSTFYVYSALNMVATIYIRSEWDSAKPRHQESACEKRQPGNLPGDDRWVVGHFDPLLSFCCT